MNELSSSTKTGGAQSTKENPTPSDDGGESRSDQLPVLYDPGPPLSLWARISRLFRPLNGATLREDITDALRTDGDSNMAFSPEERAMLNNILRLREVRVEDVMVPRADIMAVDHDVSLGELLEIFEDSGHSRMPVFCENLDDPRGMVHIRDLLAYLSKQSRGKRRNGTKASGNSRSGGNSRPRKPATFDLSRVDLQKRVQDANLIRKVLFVPPSMLASDLMRRMQAVRTQMALVIDEYGGTDGLVSLEDIVEMVVGDIEDEHDDEEVMITKTSEDVFLVDAKAELEEIREIVGPDFDISEHNDDVDTIGGLIFAALGRIPARGEVVQALPGFEFHVLDADPRRVKRVRIARRRLTMRRRTQKSEIEGKSDANKPAETKAD